tara:strand:- start:221 stop:814 length:594 start_codon:yes stop_codon:yes gene_type:complete
MAVNDFTGKNIQNTYQKVVQTDGTNLADGTGSLLPISFRGNDVVISGSLIAQTYVVSESIINISSGSTVFGDTSDDSHTFIGSVTASGNISASGTGHHFFGGTINNNQIQGLSNRSLDFYNVSTIAGTGGDPGIRFTNSQDVAIGDVDESGDGTRIEVKETNKSISLLGNVTASGNISASGDLTISNINGTINGGSF